MAITFSLKTSIKFNGKEYGSADEMPPDVRETYDRVMATIEDPSLAQGSGISFRTSSTSKIVFNGKEYSAVDQMPPDIRQAYQRVMASVTADGRGVPDALQGATAGQRPSGVRSPLTLAAAERTTPGMSKTAAAVIAALVLIIVGLLVLLWKRG